MSENKTQEIEDIRESREQRRKELGLPSYTIVEEIMNAITHGIGAGLAIAAIAVLPVFSPKNPKSILSLLAYAITLFILYIISTVYHSLGINKAKKVFRILDHCSIFLLIAGTYTPISILMIGGSVGWTIFGIIWAVAAIGITLNAINLNKFARVSLVCYIAMGWCVVFAINPLIASITSYQLWMLIWGGIAYTVGAVIYAVGKKIKYMHSIWHLFVLAGSLLHFLMIFDYISAM